MSGLRMVGWIVAGLACAACASRARAAGDTNAPERPAPYAFDSRALPLEDSAQLREALRAGDFPLALKHLYKHAYNRELPDLVFYFPPDRPCRAQLVFQDVATRKLTGAHNLWVYVFTEGGPLRDFSEIKGDPKTTQLQVTTKSSGRESTTTLVPPAAKNPARVGIETLVKHRGVTESAVLQGLFALFGKTVASDAGGEVADSTFPLGFKSLSPDSLYPLRYAYAKFLLKEGSVSRVRIALGDSLTAYATVPNYTGSHVGISVATMLAWKAAHSTRWQDVEVQPALLFLAYGQRSEQPTMPMIPRRPAIGAYLGSNLGDKPLENLCIGLALDHYPGDFGVVIGAGFRRSAADTLHPRDRWLSRFQIGLSYSL